MAPGRFDPFTRAGVASPPRPNQRLRPANVHTAKKTAQPEPDSTMDEVTYEIGVDAKRGRYETRLPESPSGCY
jgi:hypothetical protein